MTLIGLPVAVEELLASIAITLVITLFYKYLINQNDVRQLKASMKEKQAKAKELQKANPQEANKVVNEIMALSSKQMRMNTKPMLLTLALVGITLPYFAQAFPGTVVSLPVSLPFLGSSLNWFWWYVLVSIPLGYFFRKVLGVEL